MATICKPSHTQTYMTHTQRLTPHTHTHTVPPLSAATIKTGKISVSEEKKFCQCCCSLRDLIGGEEEEEWRVKRGQVEKKRDEETKTERETELQERRQEDDQKMRYR